METVFAAKNNKVGARGGRNGLREKVFFPKMGEIMAHFNADRNNSGEEPDSTNSIVSLNRERRTQRNLMNPNPNETTLPRREKKSSLCLPLAGAGNQY